MAKNMDMSFRPHSTDSQMTLCHVDIGNLFRIDIFSKFLPKQKLESENSKKISVVKNFKSGPEVEFVKSFINDPKAIFAWTSASSFISLYLFSSKQYGSQLLLSQEGSNYAYFHHMPFSAYAMKNTNYSEICIRNF